jgi:putative hydrolases of HD superfamily
MNAFAKRLEFFAATDKLKSIQRANWIREDKRFETVAEHVWHTSLLAMLFADAAPAGTDQHRVRDLLIIHDLVEVYAGDVPIWDQQEGDDLHAREHAAGVRLTALLPDDQRARIDVLWQEFQAQRTTEAQFARAIDAIHPMIMSWFPPGIGHARAFQLTPTAIIERKQPLLQAYPELWDLAKWLVVQAVEQEFIPADETSSSIARELRNHGT